MPASTIAAFEDGRVLGRGWKLPIFVAVASAFGVSIKTVEAHRANIMEKLQVTTVADLMKVALAAEPTK